MLNRIIELHDSEVEKITCCGKEIVVVFSAAYIHQSEGRPGIDPGTGWVQAAEVTLSNASLQGQLENLPGMLWEGDLKIDEEIFSNGLPVPLEMSGKIELRMAYYGEVTIQATGIHLNLLGVPEYVENFPGTD